VSPEEVEAALFLCVVRGVPFPRALVDRGALSERALEEELGRRGGLALRQVSGVPELMARLPPAMCRRLGAVPARHDAFTGTVDVAAADPLDPQVAAEFGFHLGAPIRVIRAPLTAIEEAIRRVELDDGSPSSQSRHRRSTPAFPHGAPNSSIPPPPNDDMPIPLVRRLGVPLIDEPETMEAQTRRIDDDETEEDEPVLPLKHSKLSSGHARESDGAQSVTAPMRRALREPREEPPSVSFPSSPPGANGAESDGDKDSLVETVRKSPSRPSVEKAPPARARPITAPSPQRSGAGRPMLEVDVPPARPPRAVAAYAPGRTLPAPPPVLGPPRPMTAVPEPEPEPPPLPYTDPGVVLAALREASSRDEVVRLSLRGLRLVARRVAVFAVKRDGFHGWACNPEFGDIEKLRSVVVPLDQPSILATATAASIYLGPIPGTPPHQALTRVLGRSSPDVAAVAVRAAGRAAMLLLADDLGDTLTGTRRMDELARAAGDALSRLLAAR